MPETDDCGCDGTEEFASAALAELDEDAPDLHPDPRGKTVRKWSGLVAPYGVPTGDGRRFAAGALTARELPLPVKWQRTDSAGHSTSVVVGRVDGLDFRDDGVHGWGIIFDPDPAVLPRLAEDANEAYELLKQKVNGPSVDLDAMEYHPLEEADDFAAEGKRPEIEVTKGRISAGTLVPIPAFAEARPFSLEDLDAEEYADMTSMTAAGVRQGMDMFSVAPAGHEWNLINWLTTEDTSGALYAADGLALFPVAEEVDGVMALVPAAVADAISVLAFSSDDVDLPEATKDVLRLQLEELAAACELPNPPWAQEALVASAGLPGRRVVPASVFADPKLTGPTAPRFEDLGNGLTHTYGHMATWKTCHIGFQDRCVTAPKSRTNYAYFHVGETLTDQGPVATGKITLGGGHADTRLGFQAAAEHYDDTGSAVADVRVGEDKHGIWYSGVVRSGVDSDRLGELAASPLSGDWRRIGGSMELVAALAVNTPGFPVPRVYSTDAGDMSLVAAGAMEPDADETVKADLTKKKAKKRNPFMKKDDDEDDYSLREIVREMFAVQQAEERARREDAAVATMLESDFSALDQLDLASAVGAFE